ncbi:hypothetical protein PsorP6_008001 [Peronosclerospora sorghi]|uniref:Uncharacterized protein n=1 Tax=Peronosclerospora sorghi TaxID=230839 RepID=A0ACC0WCH5_9STRA|nr:hypothetical protein PsorP6_008001 [Peronosclerospora sorghi]
MNKSFFNTSLHFRLLLGPTVRLKKPVGVEDAAIRVLLVTAERSASESVFRVLVTTRVDEVDAVRCSVRVDLPPVANFEDEAGLATPLATRGFEIRLTGGLCRIGDNVVAKSVCRV